LHDRIELCVRNSVRGKSESGLGLGLQNTKARLKYLYAEEATLSFALDNEGVATATVLLPALEGCQTGLANEAADGQCRSR